MCNRAALINQQKKRYPTQAERQKIPLGHTQSLGWMKNSGRKMRGQREEEEMSSADSLKMNENIVDALKGVKRGEIPLQKRSGIK